MEASRRDVDDLQEQINVHERRESLMAGEMNEIRAVQDQLEKGRKIAELELLECR